MSLILNLVLCRMIEMEQASQRNPNLMQTYEVMWKALKEEIQYDRIQLNDKRRK